MTATSGERLRQLVEGTFVGPVVSPHDTPAVTVVPIDWNAYDVPRLFDALRREADESAWAQARGFEYLAQVLLSQHDNLTRLRAALADSWDPRTNQSAVSVFLFLDELIETLAEDAIAHACTSRGLHGILTALAAARNELAQLKQQWDNVTTDWVPEWWDHEADSLNQRARQVVAAADKAVGDHRRQITVPRAYSGPAFVSHLRTPASERRLAPAPDGSDLPQPTTSGGHEQTMAPPAVPGYEPVPARSAELQGIAGVPKLVAAVAGSPISMLPVPPGNPYAPAGGAYVLPGPGIGRGGWIYPMPARPGASGTAPAGHGPSSVGTPTALPSSTAGADAHGGNQRPRRGHGELVWEVARGVPPVIGADLPGADEQPGEPPQGQQAQQEAFVAWFADLATPWTDDLPVGIRQTPGARP